MSFALNMSTSNVTNRESKFTRGEKCLFTHLIVTFVIILAMIIAYFVHLCLVQHTKDDVFSTGRRVIKYDGRNETSFLPVGFIYLNVMPMRTICNTLLLKQRWSVAPAHCASVRADPDMANMLRTWRIKYRTEDFDFIESKVKRSIPHPHFNRDDFSNNVGLFEHEDPIGSYEFVFPDSFTVNDDSLHEHANGMKMISWEHDSTNHGGRRLKLNNYLVRPVKLHKCHHFVSPLVDLRSYEFCVISGKGLSAFPVHGALIVTDSKIVGLFSWGEKEGKGVPFIIVSLIYFKDWIEDIISL